jgi:hypothetical protein
MDHSPAGGRSLPEPGAAELGTPWSARFSGPRLRVSRRVPQAVFACQECVFTFEGSHENRGITTLSGTVPGKLIALHRVGSPENLKVRKEEGGRGNAHRG